MDREPFEGKPTKTTFVYDTRTGKVVHVHQFVPYDANGTISDREMEQTALAQTHLTWDRSGLGVLHHGKDLEISPRNHYRVDLKTRKLVVETAPPRPAQLRRSVPTRPSSGRKAAKRAPKRSAKKR